MAESKIRVHAVDGRSLCALRDGVLTPRFVGCDTRGRKLADGELVDNISYYRRAIARGDITRASTAPQSVEG